MSEQNSTLPKKSARPPAAERRPISSYFFPLRPLVWFSRLMERAKDWMMSFAERPTAVWWLAGFSFVESSFFPIPPDVLLLPIGAARPKRALQAALVCTIASVLGGGLGWMIGYYGGRPLLKWLQEHHVLSAEAVATAERWYSGTAAGTAEEKVRQPAPPEPKLGQEEKDTAPGEKKKDKPDTGPETDREKKGYGIWVVFIAGVTPIPFKVFTIVSGVLQLSFLPFMLAAVVGRGLRFMTEGLLLSIFGVRIQKELEKRFDFWLWVLLVVGIAGFVVLKYL